MSQSNQVSEAGDDLVEEVKDVDMEEESGVNTEKEVEKSKGEEESGHDELKTKGHNVGEKRGGGTKGKGTLSTPLALDRPVRERKSVKRFVEDLEVDLVKPLVIEKGRGTPLKDIPNVSYKLAKRKPADLQLLHRTLFGRVGKAIDYKNHILQFSGFVWHESEEKQKTKVKEKLDKCVRGSLVDFCNLFDLPVSKAAARNARKEELVAMLVDFMVAPHATNEVILAEKEQQSKKPRKRKRVVKESGSKSSGGLIVNPSSKESLKTDNTPKTNGNNSYETENEEEDDGNGIHDQDDAAKHSESEGKETESEEAAEDNVVVDDDGDLGKGRKKMKRLSKTGVLVATRKSKVAGNPVKTPLLRTRKSRTKTSSPTAEVGNGSVKVFSTKRKNVVVPKKKAVSSESEFVVSKKKAVPSESELVVSKKKAVPSESDHKEKASGKSLLKDKANTKKAVASGPNKKELRKTICEILNKADFNTATFTDILKELGDHYGKDLTPRKASIKLIVQEELTKLADEAEDESDTDSEKEEETLRPISKEVEA